MINRNIRTIKTVRAIRGEILKIDLGKEIQDATIEAWMKKSNEDTYRSFSILDNRYIILSTNKASDYRVDGVVTETVEGKWYFNVKGDFENGDGPITIYQGVIKFTNEFSYPPAIIDIVASSALDFGVDVGLN